MIVVHRYQTLSFLDGPQNITLPRLHISHRQRCLHLRELRAVVSSPGLPFRSQTLLWCLHRGMLALLFPKAKLWRRALHLPRYVMLRNLGLKAEVPHSR